ncbi:hypothetical protein B0H11DRAFT_1923914 [Mycena galericulata]|nr:hypothetical protein B0H11DRAFT_1923914 [Mycena galericulata]
MKESNRGKVEGKQLPLMRKYEVEQMSTMRDEGKNSGHGKRKLVAVLWKEEERTQHVRACTTKAHGMWRRGRGSSTRTRCMREDAGRPNVDSWSSWGRRHWSPSPSWGTNAEARKMSPPREEETLLTGVVVSELRDGNVGGVRGGEGRGRPARAAHRVQDGRGTRGRRVRGQASERRGTAEGGSDVTRTHVRWLSGWNAHIDKGETPSLAEQHWELGARYHWIIVEAERMADTHRRRSPHGREREPGTSVVVAGPRRVHVELDNNSRFDRSIVPQFMACIPRFFFSIFESELNIEFSLSGKLAVIAEAPRLSIQVWHPPGLQQFEHSGARSESAAVNWLSTPRRHINLSSTFPVPQQRILLMLYILLLLSLEAPEVLGGRVVNRVVVEVLGRVPL